MGFQGPDDTAELRAVDTVGALSEAKEPPDHGFVGNTAVSLIENILDVGIDGAGPLDSARQCADRARADSPDAEAAVDRIVGEHLRLAAAGGFITGVGGLVILPVALPANVLEFYLLATRMTASIASVRGYDIRQQEIRTAVLLTLVGAEADDLLAKAGVGSTTGRLANLATQRLPGPAVMVVNKAIGFRLLAAAGGRTLSRLGRIVPVVGGVVGAGVDTFLLKKIAEQARHEFPPRQYR